MPVVEQFVDQLGKGVELCAGQAAVGDDQTRIAAAATQLHQLGQDLDMRLAFVPAAQTFESLQGPAAQRFVQGPLFIAEFHETQHFRPRRQVFQHLRFGAPEDERLNQRLERTASMRITLHFDRTDEAFLEPLFRAEQAGIDEPKEVP